MPHEAYSQVSSALESRTYGKKISRQTESIQDLLQSKYGHDYL